MYTCRGLVLIGCALLMNTCLNRQRASSPTPARPAAQVLSISNRGETPVTVTSGDGSQSVIIPAQASRTLQMPDNLQAARNIRVQNQQTGAVIYDGPVSTEGAGGVLVNEKGVSFATREDRYRAREVPSPSPFKP